MKKVKKKLDDPADDSSSSQDAEEEKSSNQSIESNRKMRLVNRLSNRSIPEESKAIIDIMDDVQRQRSDNRIKEASKPNLLEKNYSKLSFIKNTSNIDVVNKID